MATAIIILKIEDGSDELDIRVEFDPPMINDEGVDHPVTHVAALEALVAIKEYLGA